MHGELDFAGSYCRFQIADDFAQVLSLLSKRRSRVNFGDPVAQAQAGRLFVPFDARVGGNLTDHVALSLEVGVPIIKDYPVYNFKAEARLNVTY